MVVSATELIERMAGGDREAVVPFYDRFAALVYPLVLRIVGDPAAAANVHQEVFWEAWEASETYDPSHGTPEVWIVTRARRRAIDRVRAGRRRSETGVAPLDNSVSAARQRAPEAAVRENPAPNVTGDRGTVTSALERLPKAEREVIELAYYGGLTQTEIAERLTQPLETVKTRIRLGLERLREALGGRG
jgi:RNA polymerase sigma-70 factor, ECF subfamily